MATIKVPAVLGDGGASTVEVAGTTLGEVFENHAAEHGPGLKNSVFDDDEIKEFINVYVDGSETGDPDASVDDDSRIRIIPAASGGC